MVLNKDNSCRVCEGPKMKMVECINVNTPTFGASEIMPVHQAHRPSEEIVTAVWCADCGLMYHPASIW